MSKRRRVAVESKVAKCAKSDGTGKENFVESSSLIESGFLLKCPPEIFRFYSFCCSVSPESPLGTSDYEELTLLDVLYDETGLRLVGPFEILQDPTSFSSTDDLTDSYRYFHDPPELVTVLAGDDDHPFHIGYFRDDYAELPKFLVSSSPSESGRLTIVGGDIFSAVIYVLKQGRGRKEPTPSSILPKLTAFVKSHGIAVKERTSITRKSTCKTLNDVGIKIKIRNNVGYRPLPATSEQLLNILNNATDTENPNTSQLDELMTVVQFANDEGDYGEGLELGLDLLAFHPLTKTVGYQLAGRPKFAQVIHKHMEDRSLVRKLRKKWK